MTRLRPRGLAPVLALVPALAVAVAGGCRTPPPPAPPALDAIDGVESTEPVAPAQQAASDPTSRRIAELEAAIERDHRRLEALVTTPRDASSPALHENATLREIAERLTARTRELAALRKGSTRSPAPR